MEYTFEWNPSKATSNLLKHNVSFEEAATIFKDSRNISIYDTAHSREEDRWITIGLSETGKFLVVCHTFKEIDKKRTSIRIFSTRKATKPEIKQYQK
ncbi:MAG: BrnT family toxin [Chlamydiae bacterium]|nr:MAG: BrnT family toxin [Chlamydiota bacterium]